MVYAFRPCIFCKEITILHRKSVPKLIYIHILTVVQCAKDQATGLKDFVTKKKENKNKLINKLTRCI